MFGVKKFAHDRERVVAEEEPGRRVVRFDDGCNDHNGRFHHAVKPACEL